MEDDRRVLADRRVAERRRVPDRRGRGVGRRAADRKRRPPAPFGREDLVGIRGRLEAASDSGAVICPACDGRLFVTRASGGERAVLWDVYCPSCHCAALVSTTRAATVLVIDDDAIARQALTDILQQAGHEVVAAPASNVALQSYRDRPSDVVVVDMHLSNTDGLEVIRRLIREHPDARILAVSGPRRHGTPDPLAAAKRLGADGILRKPFAPATILEALHELIGA